MVLPQDGRNKIRLVSASSAASEWLVKDFDGQSTHNLAALHGRIEKACEDNRRVKVTFCSTSSSEGPEIREELTPSQLLAIAQSAAPDVPHYRTTEDGNAWMVIRQNGVRCKVLPRVERERGLLQLVLSLNVASGPKRILPHEVTAHCDGKPLVCLSAADTLALLYGPSNERKAFNNEDTSFAAVSERNNFVVPANFQRLQERMYRLRRHAMSAPPVPALATLARANYPGPPLLGDARAISALLLQRELCEPGAPERIGWIMFGGDALKSGKELEVNIDLGNGPTACRVDCP
jgi:hypothetical protein